MTAKLLGAPFWIVGLFFLYEGLAVSFPGLGIPSWSDLITKAIPTTPAPRAIVLTFLAGGVAALLALHFLRLLPWWEP